MQLQPADSERQAASFKSRVALGLIYRSPVVDLALELLVSHVLASKGIAPGMPHYPPARRRPSGLPQTDKASCKLAASRRLAMNKAILSKAAELTGRRPAKMGAPQDHEDQDSMRRRLDQPGEPDPQGFWKLA
ncbi:hypothetical protein PVAR5_0462 [Paecilomyces variotii No. 5]|uniref:Uncharacterized protein n=1 Tax=Byssochlamys spectabilis (strain No. 5 / NBRC 109023) TaxID=1356009 RepID=V5HRD3_BYSSN|nr:hypothetical protein PVAR5_0462 [Paecilomyces variotii No. 5]